MRALIRGVLLVLMLIWHIAPLAVRPLFKGFDLPYSLRVRRRFVQRTLRMLGVHLEVTGQPPDGNFIFIGNHRSYLDPIIVLRDVEAVPVGKAEVASWPLIGYGAKVSGIMFVKRESKISKAAALEAMRKVLHSGHPVLVYPEGTTHDLPQTMDFRAGAFRLAEREQIHVVPMAIDYADLSDAWVGEDTFIPHFIRCFGKKTTWVKIRYGTPLVPAESQIVLQTARQWIDENLLEMRREFERSDMETALRQNQRFA